MRWLYKLVLVAVIGCGGGSNNGGGSANGGSGGSAGAAGSAGVAGTSGTAGTAGTAGAGGAISGNCQAVNMPPPAFTPEPLLSDAAVAEAHAFLNDYLTTHAWTTATQADAETLRSAVSAAPHVFDTGIGTDCAVWIRFSDGTSTTFMSDRQSFEPDDPDPLQEPAPFTGELQLPSGPLVKKMAAGTYALPESPKAILGVADNTAPHALPKIMAALTKRGYVVEPYPKIKLADLRLAVDVGVFWLSTHGYPCPGADGMHYCLSADDPIDPATGKCAGTQSECTANRNDLAAGLVGAFNSRRDDGTTKYWMGFNEKFVQTYMKFAKNSVVFVDACSSMNALDASLPVSGSDPAPLFRQALFAKQAGVVLGWRNVVTSVFAEKAVTFFFDRTLGANQQWPMSPPQRPFSVNEVYAAMAGRNLTKDPNTIAELFVSQVGPAPDDIILAPSIRNMEIGNGQPNVQTNPGEKKSGTELMIYGEFGTRPAEVHIGGGTATPDPAKSDSKKLVIAIPGNVASGPIDVRIPTGPGSTKLTSNIVPLTQWTGTARFKEIYTPLGLPGPFNQLKCTKLRFRADVHWFRMAPETDPKPGRTDASGAFLPEVEIRNSMADTICEGSTGGSGMLGELTNSFATKTQAVQWREAADEPAAPTWWYVVNGKLNTANPSAIVVTLYAANQFYTTYTQTYPTGSTSADDVPTTMVSAIYFGKLITMDAALGITVPPAPAFPTIIGDKAELEVLLKAEPATAPNGATEG